MIHKIESETGHDFALGGGSEKGLYDIVVCKNCGVKAKRHILHHFFIYEDSFYEKDKNKILCKKRPL